jgi:hypothetical protein
MIAEKYRNFLSFDRDSTEGKLLMAALAVLKSELIFSGKYGPNNSPDDVMEKIWRISNGIYHRREFQQWEVIEERDMKIRNIIETMN